MFMRSSATCASQRPSMTARSSSISGVLEDAPLPVLGGAGLEPEHAGGARRPRFRVARAAAAGAGTPIHPAPCGAADFAVPAIVPTAILHLSTEKGLDP